MNDHSACVLSWMERTTKGQPAERQLQAFEQAFAGLWRRAHRTLGDVTLAAIMDRVLYNAARRHPILAALEIEADGLRCQRLRDNAGSLDDHQLTEGIRYVLVELLTVLGNLTADILTPSLHAELDGTAPEATSPESNDGEDAES